MKKKHSLFNIVFSICFSVYAAFPFLYISEYAKTTSFAALERKEDSCKSLCNTADFKMFVDLLLDQGGHHKKLHPFYVLFKKRNATIASWSIESVERLEKNTVIVAYFRVPSEVIHRIATPNDGLKLKESFYQSHSGLSPPSA